MWDTIIVGAIVLAAAGYALYRLFVRRSCGCGCDSCPPRPDRPRDEGQAGSGRDGSDHSCSCGK